MDFKENKSFKESIAFGVYDISRNDYEIFPIKSKEELILFKQANLKNQYIFDLKK